MDKPKQYTELDGLVNDAPIISANNIKQQHKNKILTHINNIEKFAVKMICLLFMFIIMLGGSIFIINIVNTTPIPTKPSDKPQNKYCQVLRSSDSLTNMYPWTNNYKYVIDFNQTIMQANYVGYISADGNSRGCANGVKCYWRLDPYGINNINSYDYTYTGYDRGHLVPNADYGNATYIISNAVPMVLAFNRKNGAWYNSEIYIRNNYAGKLIYKGCDYNTKYIGLSNNRKLYIPVGCYYIVFDRPTLYNIHSAIVGNVLDYGYYINSNVSKLEKKFPWWVMC